MKLLLSFITATLLLGCTIKPQPINYGEDACKYCSMTIVDRQHGAQLVTKKGKAFKFDAAECMVHFLKENNSETGLLLVTDYNNPGELMDAKNSIFVISPNISSPMKANLCSLNSQQDAISLLAEKDGKAYSWESLLNHLNPN